MLILTNWEIVNESPAFGYDLVTMQCKLRATRLWLVDSAKENMLQNRDHLESWLIKEIQEGAPDAGITTKFEVCHIMSISISTDVWDGISFDVKLHIEFIPEVDSSTFVCQHCGCNDYDNKGRCTACGAPSYKSKKELTYVS